MKKFLQKKLFITQIKKFSLLCFLLLLFLNTNAQRTCTGTTNAVLAETLDFQTPAFVSGSNNGVANVGDQYRFSNVYTGVDCLVTVNSLTGGATLIGFDDPAVTEGTDGYKAAFQPKLKLNNVNPNPGSATFTFSFVNTGGTTPVNISFYTSPLDIDSDGGTTLREFVEITSPDAYIINNPSKVTISNPTGLLRGTASDNTNGAGVATTPNYAFTGYFENRSSFTFTIGTIGTTTTDRQFSLYFQTLSYPNPVTTLFTSPLVCGKVTNNSNLGISGSTITLTGPAAQTTTTTTDASGNYSFSIPITGGLGTYKITQANTTGYGNVSDVDGANDNTINNNVFGVKSILGRNFVDGLSDLSITKTVNNANESIGNNVTFTLTAKNNGPANNTGTGVSVLDKLPTGYQYVSTGTLPTGTTYNSTSGVWSFGTSSFASGETKTLTITAKVLSTGVYNNTAVISSTGGITDPVTTNDNASVAVCVIPSITSQPLSSQTVVQNAAPTNLTVTAVGTAPFTYQWYRNNTSSYLGSTLITGATAATYTPITTVPGSNYYYVIVTNTCGSTASTLSYVLVSIDSDGDGVPDATDLDSDNDGILDSIEFNCSGSTTGTLGFFEDFGAGTTEVSSPYIPGYTFRSVGDIQNGEYTITRRTTEAATFTKWRDFTDHTGDTNGRMLVVNADVTPGEFYRRPITGIKPNIAVFFNFWTRNIVRSGENSIRPNVTFNIENSTGVVIFSGNTGNLPEGGAWQSFGGRFITAETTLTLVLINNAPGGDGNDLVLDDISFSQACDTDGDGIPDYLDLDSDNDGCSDSNEYYNNTASAATGQQFGQTGGAVAPVNADGTVIGASYTSTTAANVKIATNASITTSPTNKSINIGDNTTFTVVAASKNTTVWNTTSPFAPNYTTGTDNATNIKYQWQVSTNAGSTWTDLTNSGVYSGVTTATLTITGATIGLNNNQYRAVVKIANHVCTNLTSGAGILTLNVCYKPAVTTGTTLDTKMGITALQRAGAGNGNWPMVRKGAHVALEAKTKGFVITRIANPATAILAPIDGMMVYDTTLNCLRIYVEDAITPSNSAWKCFNTQACPD